MHKIDVPIESWGVEGSVEGLILLNRNLDVSPGLASLEVKDQLENLGLTDVQIIPLIYREFNFDDPLIKQHLHDGWPAFITAGRSSEKGRALRGASHYEIMVRERVAHDPKFIAGLVDKTTLIQNYKLLEQMHMSIGTVTVKAGLATIESDLKNLL